MNFRDECIIHQEYSHFLDPISLDIMKDPVIAADGKTYERQSISAWIETKRTNRLPLTSPLTNLPLANCDLRSNNALIQEIAAFLTLKSRIKPEDIKFSLSSDLYRYLDRLTGFFKDLNLKPPQIIVLGNESHGKSSLLERIVGLPLFPRDKHICTRCVVRVQLRRVKEANPLAEISVVNKIIQENSKGQFIPDPYNHDPYGRLKPQIIKPAVKVYPVNKVPMDNIRTSIKETMDLLLQEQPSKQLIDDREIVIKIELPFVLNLDLVDLPGLMTITPVGCSQDLPKVSRDIALNVIEKEKDFSFFILVNDVKVPPNQSRGCEIIQVAKVQDKTLGLFTKIDTFSSDDSDDSEELKIFLDAKSPSSYPVSYGWMATSSKVIVQPSSASTPLLELQKLYKIDEQELIMIQSKYPRLISTNKLGIKNIRQKIQSLYDSFVVEKWIPNIINYLDKALDSHVQSLENLGLPLGQQNEYATLLNKIQTFESKSYPKLTIIDLQQFKSIIDNRSRTFVSKANDLLSNNNDIIEFYKLKNKIMTEFRGLKNSGHNNQYNQPNQPLYHIAAFYEKAYLTPFEDAETFIKSKIENLSKDFTKLFSQLNSSIDSTSLSLLSMVLDDQSDKKNLSRFPLAVNAIKESFNNIVKITKMEFKALFEKALGELFAIDLMNPFNIIKFRYAPNLLTQPHILEQGSRNSNYQSQLKNSLNEIEWAWANPTRYFEFMELMLYQYFKVTRNIASNILKDVDIPANAFKTDSEIPLRKQYLTNMTVYLEVISDLKRLQPKTMFKPFWVKK